MLPLIEFAFFLATTFPNHILISTYIPENSLIYKKQQQTNFQKHIASLTACQLEIQESMCSLSTVKAVNAYLKEKVEENNWDFEPFQFN